MRKLLPVLILVALFSCTKDNTSNQEIDPSSIKIKGEVSSNSEIHIRAVIDNQAILLKEEIIQFGANVQLGYVNSQYNQEIKGENKYILNYSPQITHLSDDTQPTMGVRFIRFLHNPTTDTHLDNIIKSGVYSFSQTDEEYGGAVVYAPNGKNGIQYTSQFVQSDTAKFEITKVETAEKCSTGKVCKLISGTFTCELVNPNDSKDKFQVTNGTFKLRLQSHTEKY
ncbi:MAG: hypothetical protein H6584_06050 [Flavobacteriales bacterium]|nr:hypothetical protein [Flavobacteriales bacterium]